ncbi:bifunctional pyr operon transcriptional regulator/uracil phosphoribosyltransferase PyrR [Desulfonatronum thiodismutans]|uniref:bifunctional pyr operon transcriptional regulator/uracil phosphoribosyltransferase PyrR n=1 Tax=Desulfonatronum thiodismutans TaxID=159290 RepID=UPI000A022F36|nr:bifunctional pyr operon transcriptional regulator/uracil phosphoribosyltransferase PyrR [Desulfonatronum thiodismutans]
MTAPVGGAQVEKKTLLHAEEIRRTMERLAYEVIERHGEGASLALIGIQRRGVELAKRLKSVLEQRFGREIPFGSLDINLYRDDWTNLDGQPQIHKTWIPFPVDDREIILVDDVLFTGRTIRAALEAILDYGRPKRVELLVLVDRGHRELPIHADYVGKKVNTSRQEQVDVSVREQDGEDGVFLSDMK